MDSSFPNPIPDPSPTSGKSFRVALAAGVLIVALSGFFFLRSSNAPAPAAPSESLNALSPEERAYTSSVAIEHLEVSRAENFLHQEVTTISGEIVNTGNHPLAGVTLTVEFSDSLNQIAQRETRTVVAPPAPPLASGGRREFEISAEHVSSEWNTATPAVKVSTLKFATH